MSGVLVTGGSGFIGTNLVSRLVNQGLHVRSLDVARPRKPEHLEFWRPVDVTDLSSLVDEMSTTRPDYVVHLAARTDLRGSTPADYAGNVEGTASVLEAVSRVGGVRRVVHVSSLLVCRNGYRPTSDVDYCPTTPYGESKVEAERLVRGWDACEWVIARPTSIWGPWFGEPYRDFFETVLRRRYVHPWRRRIGKAFGYVENAVCQLEALVRRGRHASTHYLADDPPYRIDEFADAIAHEAGVGPPRRVPLPVLRAGALMGDVAEATGLVRSAPLTRRRLENMLTASHYPAPELHALTGPLPVSMEEGVARTVAWLRSAPSDAVV